MGTSSFQNMSSRHPSYQLGLCGTSAAFDITVASPLNSLNMLEAGMYQGVSAKAAEQRKHSENDPKPVCRVGLAMYTTSSGELWSLGTRGTEGLFTGGFTFSNSRWHPQIKSGSRIIWPP